MDLLKRLEGARLFNRKLRANLSALCCLVLLTSLRTDALESSHHPPKNLELDFSKLILPKKPTEDAPAEVGEEPGPEKFEYHLTGDVFGTTKRAPEASKALAEDEPVFLPKGKTVVPKIMTKQEDEEEEPGCDDGMPMEDAVVMPAVGFGKGIMPEAEMSSELAEPFKKDLSPIRPPVTEMPVAQDSDTTQAMPQLFAKEVMSGPLLPAEQESMEEEPSFPMKETDDVSPMKSSWFGSGILDKEESVQKETEQTAEAEPQTGDMPTTGRVFWGGMTAGSIQHAIEEQTKTEEPAVKEGIEEEEQLKTDEEKAKETDLSYKALFDTTYIKEDIARDITEQTAGESKSEEHQETELAESVKGSGGTQERTLIPFIPGTVVIPTGQKSVGSVQKSVDEPPSPSTVADEPPSSPRVVPLVSSTGAEEEEKDDVVAEETTVSTATSDVEEKKEEDTVVAEEITVSTATSDVEKMEEKDAVAAEKASAKVLGVDEKKIDDVVAEETTESTEISDEVEKKEVGAVVAEETTESTEISDEVEKKEVGAVVAEETTESTEISDEVEKKEVGAVVADETTESTEISDEVEKKEVGAVVADETTESTEISDGEEIKKEDDVRAEEITVSTEISDVEEIKKEGAVVAEETTVSTEISDEVEKKEVGAVVAEETTVSTEISDEVEKKEVGAVVAEETTVSTEISDEVEKKEVGAVVADETTESTEISDGEEIKKEDDVRAEEITVSTEISDVKEKKGPADFEAEETTVSTEISDEVEKKEVGAVVAEETTESTEISDEVEKKEEIDTKDHPALSEPVSSVSSEKDPVVEVSSPSPDAIPSETPIESPPSESTPVLSQEPPQEPETKQEPAADPEKAEDVKAVELPLPEQSPAHPDEEKQVQEEDQASSSSTTEEAPVEARAAEPQAPAIQQVSTMASLKEILGSALANATNVKTDVETEEGKVAILIEEGGEVELERLELEPLEGVDILVKVAAGGELRLNDVSIRDRPQRRLRRALNGQASIKTGLLVDGGSVLSIRDSTFESATDTMIKVTQGSHLSCSGCVFRNNAGDRGGALLVQDSTLHLRSCKMTENVASSGGAIHFDGGGSAGDFVASARIEDTVFSGNEARGSGAGVYMSSARAINVVDSKFQHGSASNGGAVYIRDVYTVQIDRSRFSNNRADVSGGGLVAESIQTLSVLKSTFKNNEALGLFAGAGLISDCSDATFRATNFVENHAVEGGALANIAYSTHLSRFYLQNTQFINNKADNLGGALLIRGDKKSEASHDEKLTRPEPFLASINSTRFSGNAARKGGGVFISFDVLIDFYVKTAMQRTNFTQNKASETGGGIYCGEHSTVVLSSSKFEHNEAYAGMNCAEHCGCQVNASYIVCLNPLAFVFR